MPVLLRAGGAQAVETETLDDALPGEKLFNRQRVPPTSIFEAEQPATRFLRADIATGSPTPASRKARYLAV